ncbi:MAG: bifunctional acetate--CoA ligase family protein/GNAT family N-acetyltransferase [Syntrophales bacterium]|nr:bifunctional acetate--CoA ligase family protein/GNAT family N-acetyltransferase [Syntrophales bacterium]
MDNLTRMFDPQTIAVIGASDKEGSPGRIVVENLLSCRGQRVFTINPNQTTVCNNACYDTIGSVPEHVDLAIVTAPAAAVPGIVDDCGQAGVDGMIIISDGFREIGAEGRRLEEEIIRIKKGYPMRILGPNCLGIIRPHVGLCAARLPAIHEKGSIALLTQSSSFEKILFDWGVNAHVSFSMLASLGSGIDIDFGDMIDYLGNDPHTRSIMIYMEDRIIDIKKFASAARGFARNKPIVLLKPPQIPNGTYEKLSHTDMLAGPEDVFDAILRRVGVVRVKEAQDLYNTAAVLYSRKLPSGPRLAIMTNITGTGLMAANRLLRSRGQLAELSSESLSELDQVLPPYWRRGNPVDMLRSADVGQYEKVIRICLRDENVDGILVISGRMYMENDEELAEMLVGIARDAAKPVITAWLERDKKDKGWNILTENGIPTYGTPEGAVRTYLYLHNYERNLQNLHETPSELPVDEAPSKNHLKSMIRRLLREGATTLTDEDSRKFLANYGIPLMKTYTAHTVEEAIQYADMIGYPVVLKISSPDIIFRQDVGGVVMGITTHPGLRREYDRLVGRVKERLPGAIIHGVTIQKMIEVIDYEVILGARKDPDYGAAILFGMGGIGVEIFQDYAVGLPPLNQALARRLMEDTKVYKMLQGYRGKAPADLRMLERIIVSFSDLIVDFPEILAMDMNPIAISAGKAVALDARIILDQHYIQRDAPYPHLVFTPYPMRYVTHWRLPNGTDVLLRPIKPEDEPLEHEMFTSLSEASPLKRFYRSIKAITHEMHVRFCNIDYDREMAIVAEIRENGNRRIIGIGSFMIEPDRKRCEFSVLVHDDYQGQGLASKLVDIIIGIADEKELDEFYGYIEPTNRKMASLTTKLGMVPEKTPYDLTKMTLRLR